MKLRLLCVFALLAGPACASHDDAARGTSPTKSADEPPQPDPQPKPEPEPDPQPAAAKASIASVQMIQDCPDPAPSTRSPSAAPAAAATEPKPSAQPKKESRARAARGSSLSGRGPRQPCTQSTMQLAFAGQGDDPGPVVIERATLLDAQSADTLATIASRRPTAWVDDAYREWDEIVPAGEAMKASYSLSVPDWNAVETKIGGTSFGHMFVLEVELTVAGQRQTVRSPAFTRERPHVIVT